ncbi:MAG: HAD family hydrolase [Parasphingopyxis sp.]|nr:HAD family phosphatase [Sphingomonadales bacterium]
MKFDAIIFDFDGVIVDSEIVSNSALAETLTRLGSPTTVDQALERYCGKRWTDCTALIEAQLGRKLPDGFVESLVDEAVLRLAAETELIGGVADFIESHRHRGRAIASSSASAWLFDSLARFGIDHHFGTHVYSAAEIDRGKPHPDIYLHAADRLAVHPERTLVIEDSPTGVAAGVAAGMTVVGFLGGSHIRDGHGERLRDTGAHHLVEDYAALDRLISELEE